MNKIARRGFFNFDLDNVIHRIDYRGVTQSNQTGTSLRHTPKVDSFYLTDFSQGNMKKGLIDSSSLGGKFS